MPTWYIQVFRVPVIEGLKGWPNHNHKMSRFTQNKLKQTFGFHVVERALQGTGRWCTKTPLAAITGHGADERPLERAMITEVRVSRRVPTSALRYIPPPRNLR